MSNFQITNKSQDVFIYTDDCDSIICFMKGQLWETVPVGNWDMLAGKIIESLDLSLNTDKDYQDVKGNNDYIVGLITKIATLLSFPPEIVDEIAGNHIVVYKNKIAYCANIHLSRSGNKYNVFKNEDILATICWNKRSWMVYLISVIIVLIVIGVSYNLIINHDEKEVQTVVENEPTTIIENISTSPSTESETVVVEEREEAVIKEGEGDLEEEVPPHGGGYIDEVPTEEQVPSDEGEQEKEDDDNEYQRYFSEGNKAYSRYFSEGKKEKDRIDAIHALESALRYKNSSEVKNMLNALK